MTSILHVLPHPGGGGERIVDMLEGLGGGYAHRRILLSPAREPLRAAPHLAARWPRLAKSIGAADLVHVVGDTAALLCLPLLARRPAVIATQGLHFLRRASGLRRRIAERGLQAAVARASRTVCSSRAERDELASVVGRDRRDRLRVVLNGVFVADPPAAEARAEARRELGLSSDSVVGLFLGELEERKDPLTAIGAARAAAGRGAALVLLVAGEGPLLDAARGQAGDSVRVLGYRDDPGRLLAAADFLTLPSRREGLSLAMLEAMSAGLPVVAADVPASREAIGETGILVPPGDAGGFARAFEELVASAELRTGLGQAAHRRAVAHFRAERYLSEIREIFEESLAGARPGPHPA